MEDSADVVRRDETRPRTTTRTLGAAPEATSKAATDVAADRAGYWLACVTKLLQKMRQCQIFIEVTRLWKSWNVHRSVNISCDAGSVAGFVVGSNETCDVTLDVGCEVETFAAMRLAVVLSLKGSIDQVLHAACYRTIDHSVDLFGHTAITIEKKTSIDELTQPTSWPIEKERDRTHGRALPILQQRQVF